MLIPSPLYLPGTLKKINIRNAASHVLGAYGIPRPNSVFMAQISARGIRTISASRRTAKPIMANTVPNVSKNFTYTTFLSSAGCGAGDYFNFSGVS